MKKKCVNFIDLNNDRSEKIKYTYADLSLYFHKGRFSSYPDFTMKSHWHDDFEFIVPLSGRLTYNVNGQLVSFGEGEGIFVNSRRLHSGFSDNKTECEYYVLLFHPTALCSVKQFEQNFVQPAVTSPQDCIHLKSSVPWQAKIIDLVHNIAEKSESETAPLTALGSVYLIWDEIFGHIDLSSKPVRGSEQLSELKAMLSFIHEHYHEKIMLADIAEAGYVSKRGCSGLFLKYLYKTPIEYLNDYRLQKSIELMKSTDMTILEICIACGFSGASYYSEIFRKNFGKSPTEYRRSFFKS